MAAPSGPIRPRDVLAGRLVAQTEAGRQAVAPLTFVTWPVVQPFDAETVQDIVLPFAGLAVAVLELEHARALTLALRRLANVAGAVLRRDALGVLQSRP